MTRSTAGAFRLVAELLQFRDEAITMIALYFDDALLHGTARSAEFFQPRAEFLEFCGAERQSVNN